MPTTGTSWIPAHSRASTTALSWPVPPSISSRSGHSPRLRSGSSASSLAKRRPSTSRIIAKSLPGTVSGRLMLHFREAFLRKLCGAGAEPLAHHRVVVAGHGLWPPDVELPVGVRAEALGPGDDHRSDRVGAHPVAVVIDLDPLRRLRELEQFGQRPHRPRLSAG